jgi:hypothetical protein
MGGAVKQRRLALVEAWPNWPAAVVILSGPGAAARHTWRISGRSVPARSSSTRPGSPPAQPLQVCPAAELILEDIDPDNVPEQALFHLINSAKEAGIDFLITSARRAQEWAECLMPDLGRSRLAPVYAPPH